MYLMVMGIIALVAIRYRGLPPSLHLSIHLLLQNRLPIPLDELYLLPLLLPLLAEVVQRPLLTTLLPKVIRITLLP